MKISINMPGVDGLAAEFANLAKSVDKVADKMIKAGGKEGVKAYQDAIRANKHIKSGEMLESVKMGKPHKANAGVYAYIYPTGQDKRGVDNYMKAKRANFGTSKDKGGSHFVDQAQENANGPAVDAMRQVWESMKEG